MSSIDERAKQAAEARMELEQALNLCAEALQSAAEVMAKSSMTLAAAAQREQQATCEYIACLEAQLSHQQSLS